MRMSAVAISRALLLSCLALGLLAGVCTASQQQQDFYILFEDGSRMTYGDLRAISPHACCFPVNFPFSVTYSSTNRIRMFIGNACDPGLEINSSAFPAMVKQIDLCATGCDPQRGCGLNAMNTKGTSTAGGKWPLNQGQECADKDTRRLFTDKTCKAVGENGQFKYRLQCKQDCTNAWTCQEPGFDKSKCAGGAGSAPVTTFVALGQRCGYTQDNKVYACGGNHVACTNGVCVSTLPRGR